MTEKKGEKKIGEGFGISGFTLSIAGIYAFIWIVFLSMPLFICGLIFSWIQMKNKKTKLALSGLIINIIGILLSIATLMIVVYYPDLLQGIQ